VATASNVPDSPRASDPAHDALVAARFHVSATSSGTPCVKRTDRVPDAPPDPGAAHEAESHATRPCRVTITRATEEPNGSSHPEEDVETA